MSTQNILSWQPVQYATHYRAEQWRNSQWQSLVKAHAHGRLSIDKSITKIRIAPCLGKRCGQWRIIRHLDQQSNAGDKAQRVLAAQGVTAHPTANLTLASGDTYLTANNILYRVDEQQNIIQHSLPGLLVQPPLLHQQHLYMSVTDIDGKGHVCRATLSLQQLSCHNFDDGFRVTPNLVTGDSERLVAVSHTGKIVLFTTTDFVITRQLPAIQIQGKPVNVMPPVITTQSQVIVQLKSQNQQHYVYAMDTATTSPNQNPTLRKVEPPSRAPDPHQITPQWITELATPSTPQP